MNHAIKNKIEEINKGRLPDGYKKTPLGIFPYDWAIGKQLKDFCSINPKTDPLDDRFIYIDLESVLDGKLVSKTIIQKENAPSRAQRVLIPGDVIYQVVRPYQRNNYLFLCPDKKYQTVASTGYAQLRNNCPSFLYQLINSDYFCKQAMAKCTGTNYPAINSTDLGEIVIAYPKGPKEQEKIAEILLKWDEAVELQEKYIEKLKQYKAICLQKMFPRKSETVPEWRFKGFTDPWEQRKLGELSNVSTGFPFDSKDFADDGQYLVITNGNIQDASQNVDGSVGNRISIFDEKIVSTYLLNVGDILVTMDGTVGRTAKVIEKKQILAQRVGRIKATINGEFLYQWLNTGTFSRRMTELSHGGTIKHISLEEMRSFDSLIPCSDREQLLIGSFLGYFDNLITLHQHKLESIQKQRKAMQQLLLNGIVRVK